MSNQPSNYRLITVIGATPSVANCAEDAIGGMRAVVFAKYAKRCKECTDVLAQMKKPFT